MSLMVNSRFQEKQAKPSMWLEIITLEYNDSTIMYRITSMIT